MRWPNGCAGPVRESLHPECNKIHTHTALTWILKGFDSVLTLFWLCFDSVLTLFWLCFDSVLALFWLCFDSVLTLFWLCFDSVLTRFWLRFDSVLTSFWLRFDYVLTPFWLRFDSILTRYIAANKSACASFNSPCSKPPLFNYKTSRLRFKCSAHNFICAHNCHSLTSLLGTRDISGFTTLHQQWCNTSSWCIWISNCWDVETLPLPTFTRSFLRRLTPTHTVSGFPLTPIYASGPHAPPVRYKPSIEPANPCKLNHPGLYSAIKTEVLTTEFDPRRH